MARRAYDPDNPEAYEAQRNLLDLYGNYVQGPRTDRSSAYDPGLWGSAGVPMFEQLSGDDAGVNFTGNSPLTFAKNGQEMFRIGQRGTEIPDVWKGTEYEKQIQFDPTYGYYMPKDSFFEAQKLFPKDMGWLGPLGMMGAMFALPMLTQMGALGAGAAGGAAEAGASAGGGLAEFGGAGGGLAEGGINFADSFLPTLTSEGGMNFADSFLPTLTSGGGAVASAGPLASLGDMAAVLGSGGELSVAGLGGLEAALGLPAGGLAAALQGTGITIPGPMGDLTLDAAGNLVSTAIGGAAPWLKTLIKGAGSLTGNGGGSGSGSGDINWPGVGTSVAQGFLSKYLADKYDTLARDLADRADPFGSENVGGLRKTAQNEYATQYSGGPLSWMDTTYKPFAERNMDIALRKLSADHGNPALSPAALSEAVKYTTETGYGDYLKSRGQVAGEAGAGFNPASGAGLYGQAASAGLNQLGNIGGALGSGISYATGGTGSQQGDNLMNLLKGGLALLNSPT